MSKIIFVTDVPRVVYFLITKPELGVPFVSLFCEVLVH